MLKSVLDRLSGKYRRRERFLSPAAAAAVGKALDEDDFGESGLAAYLELWLPALRRMTRPARLSLFMGDALAALWCNIARDEIAPAPALQYRWLRECFGQDDGSFDFGGARLPFAEESRDEPYFCSLFHETILPDLLGPQYPDIQNFFTDRAPYERDGVQLRKGDVVLDCGASAGFFAALASSKGCRVHAFEPSFVRERYLDRTADLNPNIVVCPRALSERSGIAHLFVPESDMTAGFLYEEGRKPPSRPGRDHLVETVAVDDYVRDNGLERVDFIKADLVGSELRMIEGAKETLRAFAPRLAISVRHGADDPVVLPRAIRDAQPRYTIIVDGQKLYAHV